MRIHLICLLAFLFLAQTSRADDALRIRVAIDRGQDIGQSFGSLFEATSRDGSFVIGAGFQNAYNTRYRADRHAIQFYVRPTQDRRQLKVVELPRPTKNLVGSYLFERDGTIYSTYGGLKSWDPKTNGWRPSKDPGGTSESMRVGNGTLTFANSQVTWNGKTILKQPSEGSYQLFFYANGYLCFYHVHRKDGPYRLYKNDSDGFSRLYACPWTPADGQVDLSKAIVHKLPVVGETTFAWGQIRDQIVTGSNIGGFYIFENGKWRMTLEPKLNESYQLYSSLAFRDQLLLGQYPTGRVFTFDGKKIKDQPGWPPVPPSVSKSAREAQTTAIYGGSLIVGVWPWGEVWRHSPDTGQWTLLRRMFSHPEPSNKIVHPYDVENKEVNPGNKWGQRVTSLVPSGANLFISTSAKAPYEWNPDSAQFLLPNKWKDYGKVYRTHTPGHLSATTNWTEATTTLEFTLYPDKMQIHQDGKLLASTEVTGVKSLALNKIQWGKGIYGTYRGKSINGHIH